MKKLYLIIALFLFVPSMANTQNLGEHRRARIKQLLETDQLEGALWRALVKITLSEINALRTNAGLPARTEAQVINALKSELGVK